MRYLLDTNIFVRVATETNGQMFEDCLKLLQAVKMGKIRAVTTNIVLAEFVWVLGRVYGLPKLAVLRALKSVRELAGLKIVDSHDLAVAIDYYERFSVKYIDCLLASTCLERTKWTIISYDKDFDVLGVLRCEPRKLLG